MSENGKGGAAKGNARARKSQLSSGQVINGQGAGKHCAHGHGDLRHNGTDVVAEHLFQIVHKGFGGGHTAAARVEKEIQPLVPVHLVDTGHEAVLVFIVDFDALDARLCQEARVVSDHVSTGVLVYD